MIAALRARLPGEAHVFAPSSFFCYSPTRPARAPCGRGRFEEVGLSSESARSTPTLDVYLSVARPDVPHARTISKALRAAGLSTWVAEPGTPLPGGWLGASTRAIRQARRHVLVLSERSPLPWQHAELDFAAQARARGDEIDTVPVLLDGHEPPAHGDWLDRFDPVRLSADRLDEQLAALAERLQGPPGMPSMPASEAQNPYPGLLPYGVGLARYFFGRDRELADAALRLGRQEDGDYRRWLRVEGPPGIGKTSFVRAGLVPAVLRGAVHNAPPRWRVAAFRPDERPVENLIAALAAAFEGQLGAAELESLVRAGGLDDLVREHLPADEGLLLVVDHVDDVITEAVRGDEVPTFDRLLAEALDDFDQRLLLVTTGRTDLAPWTWEALPALAAVAPEHGSTYLLGGLTRSGVREVVHGPARMAGRAWPPDLADRIVTDAELAQGAPGLICGLLAELAHRPGADVARYEALGGVADAVGHAGDDVLHGLSEDDQPRAHALLMALLGAGRGRIDHGLALPYPDAVAAAGSGPRAERLVERLEAGLRANPEGLRTPLIQVTRDGPGERTLSVRLVHEALPRLWPTLRRWVEHDRVVLERRHDVELAAQAWVAGGREADGLPDGGRLLYYAGGDLDDGRRARLLAGLRDETRRFVQTAEAAASERQERDHAHESATRTALAAAHASERTRLLRRVGRLRVLALLLLAGVSGLGGLVFTDRQRVEEMEAVVRWSDTQRQRMAHQLREAEQEHLEAERRRLSAEGARRETELARRQANRLGARAEESADTVTEFAIEVAMEADAYFSRVRGTDAQYARRAYAEAVLQRIDGRLRENPDNDRLKILLARQHTLLGDLAADINAYRFVEPQYEKAVAVLHKLTEREDPDPRNLQRLAEAYDRLGGFFGRPNRVTTDHARAAGWFEKAIPLWERLSELEPATEAHVRALADSLARAGVSRYELKAYDVARTHLVKAVEATKGLVDAHPEDTALAHDLARRTGYVGDVELDAGNVERAAAVYRTATQLLEAAARTDPEAERTLRRLQRKLRASAQ